MHRTPEESLVAVRALQKAYRADRPVLRGIDCTFAPGEFVGLLGLSGAGKSTFLRCINRLIDPSSGEIHVPRALLLPGAPGTLDIVKASPGELRAWRRRVGMIFQQFNLVRRLSVLDNVLAGILGGAGLPQILWRSFPESERDRALYNLERVGLLDYAYRRADELSGGQQQRVAIARALMQRPALILADEPVASLDPKLSAQVLGTLRRIAQEDGITVIVSLHVLDLARQYADRLLGFQSGQVVFNGRPDSLDEVAYEQIYRRSTRELVP